MTPDELRCQEEELFKAWKGTKDGRLGFAVDGAVYPERYLGRGKPKILFILKEVNNKEKGHGRLGDHLLGPTCGWPTWNNVVRWKLLLDALEEDRTLNFEQLWKERLNWIGLEDRNRELRDVAVMNLKKTPGGASSSLRDIADAAATDRAFLDRQMRMLDPDVIVVGGDMHPKVTPLGEAAAFGWISGAGREVQGQIITYDRRPRMVFWTYHPQARKGKRRLAEGLAEAYRSLKK